MTLNDIYHVSMIIIGFGTLLLGWLTFLRLTRKNRQRNITNKKR